MGSPLSKGRQTAGPEEAPVLNKSPVQAPRQQPSEDGRIKILLLGDTGSGKSRVFSILSSREAAAPTGAFVKETVQYANPMVGLSAADFDLDRDGDRETLIAQWREKAASIGVKISYSRFAAAQYCVEHLASPDFTPDDWRHLYVRTTGILEGELKALPRAPTGVVIDVGGRRNERKKWVHAMSGVSMLIVCVSLMSVSAELANADGDNECDGLALWKELALGAWFRETPLLLVFTHYDSLVAELKARPYAQRWPQCPHTTPRQCAEWLVEEFRKISAGRGPTPAVVCALSTPAHDAKLTEAIDTVAVGGTVPTTQWVTSSPVWPSMRVFLAAAHKQRGDESCPAASLPLDVYKYMLPFFRSVVSGACIVTDGTLLSRRDRWLWIDRDALPCN